MGKYNINYDVEDASIPISISKSGIAFKKNHISQLSNALNIKVGFDKNAKIMAISEATEEDDSIKQYKFCSADNEINWIRICPKPIIAEIERIINRELGANSESFVTEYDSDEKMLIVKLV